MKHGQISFGQAQSAWLLTCGIRFFLAAALTASQTPGAYAPFALGFVAAAGAGGAGIAALTGTGIGALLFLDFASALPHLAIAILLFSASTAFRGMDILTRPYVLPLIASGLCLAVGTIYVSQSLSPLTHLTHCLAAVGMTGVSTYFFQPLLQHSQGKRLVDAILFLIVALVMALSDLEVLGISLGRTLLCILLAWIAYDRGALVGVAVGLGLGLMADLCAGGGSTLFSAALGLAGLLTGSRTDRRRSSAALAFFVGVVAAMLPAEEFLLQPLLVESSIGMTLFLLLPARLFGGKRLRREDCLEKTELGIRLKERLNRAADALRDLYDSMGRNMPQSNDENPAIIFDRAAEKVCRGCALCELCWQKEYSSTFNALNDSTPYMLERGRVMSKDFPRYFADRCIHLIDFITAVNGELSAFLLRRQYRRQLEETRRSARGQYAQLSELLSATAAGLEEGVPAFGGQSCRVGAVLRPKEGESVCGDTLVSFQTDAGIWCLLLADGMGSGEEARRESALTCRLLRQFLEAEIQPEAALKTLNSAMALRGAETGSFTTIDLCVFDCRTGEAVFYKYGAAPSYLKRGGAVRRITGGSLPVGLRGTSVAPDITRVPLEPGSFAVMISDGVADSGQDEWLLNLLAGWEGDDPQVLAGLILKESVQREHLQDDCGVQVLYRPEMDRRRV